MPRFINPEDWFLVVAVLTSFATFPVVMLIVVRAFHIPSEKVFCKENWFLAGQILGIVLMILLLVQVGIHSDGLGAKLIYGRF